MSKTKRLLSVTLASVMLFASAFSAFAEETEIEVETLSGTVTAEDVTVKPGVTEVEVPVTIAFENDNQVSPHGQFDIAAEGATLESATFKKSDNANFEPDAAVPDGAGLVDKSIYVGADGVNTANGRIIVESDVSEGMQPSVSYVTVDVVLGFDTALAAGQVIDVVISNIAATNLSEAPWTGMSAVNGKITVEADVTHEAAADWSYDDTNHWHACVVEGCTEHIGENAYDYAEHSFGDWIIDTEATTSASGSKHRDCACGKTETAVIPRVLKMNSVSLTLANSIAVNFKANANHFTEIGYNNPYAIFVRNGKETIVTEYTIEASTGRYVFAYPMTPQSIADTFEVYLCATYNGEVYKSAALEYNIVEKYCLKEIAADSATQSFRTLIVDLLNYATACQIKQSYNTSNLANSKLTDEQIAWGTTTDKSSSDYKNCQNTKYVVIDNPTAAFKTAGLSLDTSVVVRFTATLPEDISNITLKATNGTTEWVVTSDEFAAFTHTDGNTRYQIMFAGLAAHQMDDEVQFTFYNGDTAISNTFLYSVETYVASNLDGFKSSDPNLANVLVEMMDYGYAANSYQ